MKKRKHKIGFFILTLLLDRIYDDLSLSRQQELINTAAARRKYKEQVITAEKRKQAQIRARQAENVKLIAKAEQEAAKTKKSVMAYLDGICKGEQAG